MRTVILLLLITCCCCRTKLYNCVYPTYKVPINIAFQGFPVADIDTIIISYYTPDSTFSHLLQTDTVISDSIYSDGIYEFRNDSVKYLGSSAYFAYVGNTDLEIYLPANGDRFFIHSVYSKDTLRYAQEENSCGSRSFQLTPNVSINGHPATSAPDSFFLNRVFISP